MATTTRSVGSARPSGPERYGTLQRLLERQQQVLRTRKDTLRERARGEMLATTDIKERSEDLVDFGVGLVALELSARTVQGIETALRRLNAGTYDICFDCNGRISSVRLSAVPFAERCHGCQEQYDSSRRGRGGCA